MLDITHIYSNDPSFHLSENIKVALVVKNLLAEEELVLQETQEMWVQSLGREDPLEAGMATHSSILAWRVPWTEEPGGPWSIGSQSQT